MTTPEPTPQDPEQVLLSEADLHPSVSQPLMDTMTFLNEITLRYPDAISFAPGRPYEGDFDVADIAHLIDAYVGYLRQSGRSEEQIRTALFQYGETAGQIRELVADMLRKDEEIDVPTESLVVTVGCQEALLLVLRTLCSGPDDVLLVDSPCYVGVTGAASLLDIPVAPVASTPYGVSRTALRDTVERLTAQGRRPRALYIVPDCSNPTGASMPTQDRVDLLETARSLGLLLLEDNPYGLFSSRRRPTLKALDRRQQVIYLGSFAKTAFPGARIGYVVADQRVRKTDGTGLLADEIAKVKSMVTVNTPSVSQAAVAGLLVTEGGSLRRRNETAARHYQDTMRRVRNTLAHEFPPAQRSALGVHWNDPDGGFFLTVDVPFPADESALRTSAQEYGVMWTPMRFFHLDGSGDRQMRLSCSYVTTAEAETGATRLARFIKESV
ncbi:PLP-dependent aminotransferase family protein [Streptomyces sp. AC550_RSS872]|uniref:aminotransferase-like domain-containing protein n=1 Tax=Streptomyces sp. AC550_RSS872 TaxID=2823689 RepID=UPI0027E43797|nr:PLP-dependent aminotransferase family protein [Streptomyces sp. AC550_RSS872]